MTPLSEAEQEEVESKAILAGTETQFHIGNTNTLWEQYKVQVY